ncbi:hypothetical protein BTO30_03480 [Domibacillus antri]|uniref:Uncharacterized protein n=1 Tax=Domibacillus antri TaxID=1714264 RepID=A0A1Q8Q8L8_9BACI|nr:hypothetical protein BTO30_03480 [Domibacillus antri]
MELSSKCGNLKEKERLLEELNRHTPGVNLFAENEPVHLQWAGLFCYNGKIFEKRRSLLFEIHT